MASFLLDTLNTLFTARYITVASLVCLVYDHIQTLHIEFKNVWTNKKHKNWYKLSFVVNRYLSEAVVAYVIYVLSGRGSSLDDAAYVYINCSSVQKVSDRILPSRCRRFVWVFTIMATVVVAVSQFFINLRVYQTWETREHMTIILTGGFAIFISGVAVLAVLTAIEVQPDTHFIPIISVCTFFKIPIKLQVLLGILASFDLFLIILAVYNALDRPHKTNSEVIESLHLDGAKLYFLASLWHLPNAVIFVAHKALIVLRLANMVVSIIGRPPECFSVMCLVFALNSVIVSRMHLRLEGLRFLTIGFGKSFLDF
ncbi:hypothetical protein MPER_12429 [Moniliophthora perniciosa FA553]|nr:hypothetical protein MPER_12429 [Moniliophthora perniciosa FA553]